MFQVNWFIAVNSGFGVPVFPKELERVAQFSVTEIPLVLVFITPRLFSSDAVCVLPLFEEATTA